MAITRNKLEEYKHWQPKMTKIIDGKPVRFLDVKVYEFRLGDVDDVEIYTAGPLHDWSQTEVGQWVFEHAVNPPYWMRQVDYFDYGYLFVVMARMSEANATFFNLKYAKPKN